MRTQARWRSFPGYVMLSGLQWLRRSRSLKLLRQIEREPFLSKSEVQANQLRRLSKLLAHAEQNVPYYRELFSNLKVSSRDIRSVADLAQIPLLTKDIVRERWRDLVREDVSIESLSRHHSGGSTGVPVTFYRDRSYMDASEAGTFRNFTQAGWRPGEMIAFFWGSNKRLQQMSKAEFELRQKMRRMYQFDPFDSGEKEFAGWLKKWPSIKPTIIHGYASTIARFAQHIVTRERSVAPLKGVFSTAEKLYLPQRKLIERVFRCRVYDCYGSSEVQNIASECALENMHVNADFVVLEVERRRPGDQDSSPLIVTSLRNYAMPFIRYYNEDCGRLAEHACSCGNNFPLMHLSVARVSDNFVMPDGRVVHGEFFTHLMYGSEGIETFQFHQTTPDHITLWIVAGRSAPDARERTIRAAVESIKALTDRPVTVEVRETESIPLSNAGKHRFTRSDVSASVGV
jgi:phenylacetate-coenzyme A ligase PaaK-like adenylate-forming protein